MINNNNKYPQASFMKKEKTLQYNILMSKLRKSMSYWHFMAT